MKIYIVQRTCFLHAIMENYTVFHSVQHLTQHLYVCKAQGFRVFLRGTPQDEISPFSRVNGG